jgi:hypothetical protein
MQFQPKSLLRADQQYQDLVRELGALPREAELAACYALNRASTSAIGDIVGEVSGLLKISPKKVIRKRIRLNRAKLGRPAATIRIMTNPVPAIRLAGIRDTGSDRRSGGRKWGERRVGKNLRVNVGSGVTAPGGFHWPDAFIEEGIGGHTMVFRRKGPGRRPIEAVKIDIQAEAISALNRHAAVAAEATRELADRDLQYRVDKRMGRL